LGQDMLCWSRNHTPMRSSNSAGNRADAWMQGRSFHPTEGGLETTVIFKGVCVRILCYPDVFALEKSVWELGHEALKRSNNRGMFDTAFKLLNDRTLQGEPNSLAHVLLLLNQATKPAATDLATATYAATSAAVFAVMARAVRSDVENQRQHMSQKIIIADVLKDQFGFCSQSKTGDPQGWMTFPLKKPTGWNGLEIEECFHGTSMTALAPILREGLKKPKRWNSAHGQCGSTSKQTIYLTPSWHYAAHPVYSPLHLVDLDSDASEMCAFQMVLKCEVREGQYKRQPSTLGSKHWEIGLRIDPDRDTLDDMEYLVEEEGVVRVKEVMFRRFGKNSDPNIFGPLPPQLAVTEDGREYRWTKMLQRDFRARNLYLRPQ